MANGGEYQISRWRRPDGSLSTSRIDAVSVDLDSLRAIISEESNLPTEWLVVMAINETGNPPKSNQEDTDYYADGSVKKETFGIYQLTKDEASEAGEYGDLLDPRVNVRVFSAIMEKRLETIMATENARRASLGLDPIESPTLDAYRYLSWAHNNGIGAVTKSIQKYGMDWSALKARDQNSYMRDRLIPYAERATAGIRDLLNTAIETTSAAIDDSVDFVETTVEEYSTDEAVIGVGTLVIVTGIALAYLLSRG